MKAFLNIAIEILYASAGETPAIIKPAAAIVAAAKAAIKSVIKLRSICSGSLISGYIP